MRYVWVLTRTASNRTIVIGVFASRELLFGYLREHFGHSFNELRDQQRSYWTIERDPFVFTVEQAKILESRADFGEGRPGN